MQVRSRLALSVVCGIVACCGVSRAAPGLEGVDAPAVVEISQAPRVGLWSAWLSSGIRVHAKTLPQAAEPTFAIVVTITGGELLEPPGSRGLADAATAAWSLPKDPEPKRAEVVRRYLESQIRFKPVAQTDCLQLVLIGPESDLGLALELARVLIEQPGHDAGAFEARLTALREMAADARSNPDRLAIDGLRVFALPPTMPGARAIDVADLATLSAPVARDWLAGALLQGSIEIGIASRTPAPDSIRLAAEALGTMTTRPRIASSTLAELRDGPREGAGAQAGAAIGAPTITRVPCVAPCEDARAVVAFLGPHRSDLPSRRALALAAFVIDDRAEAALKRASAADAARESRVRTLPSAPGVRTPRALLALVIATAGADAGDLPADLATAEQIITDLATLGPLPAELDEAKARVAEILGAQDLAAEAWATKLATLTYDGLTPALLANAIDSYQAIGPDDVRRTLAAWWPLRGQEPPAGARVVRTIIAPE